MSAGIIGGNVLRLEVRDVTLDVPSIAANTSEENTFTVSGLKTGDHVYVAPLAFDAGVVVGSARVTAKDTLALQHVNATGSGVDPSSQDYRLLIVTPE